MLKAIAMLSFGFVTFTQHRGYVLIEGQLKGVPPGKHGFHIHEFADLRRGCDGCCSHYNPYGAPHGGLDDANSHAGDLGNVTANRRGEVTIFIETSKFRVQDILGRSIILHADEDDLGKGGYDDSLTTGHSGARIACGVIGRAE